MRRISTSPTASPGPIGNSPDLVRRYRPYVPATHWWSQSSIGSIGPFLARETSETAMLRKTGQYDVCLGVRTQDARLPIRKRAIAASVTRIARVFQVAKTTIRRALVMPKSTSYLPTKAPVR